MSTPTEIETAFREARAFFASGRTRDIAFRENALRRLLEAVQQSEDRLAEALRRDLGKPALEAFGSEIFPIKGEIRLLLKNLRAWSRPEKVRTPWWLLPAASHVRREPFGTALILSPWNYPLQLALMPLAAALAAGNTAVIKPSELAPHGAQALEELLSCLEPGLVRVVQGGAETARELLGQPFNFFFFTGSGPVGKKVALAAAEHSAPCVLELGGKNPCIVDESAPLAVTARRVVWGKFFNAGQTCLAPDHLLVHRNLYHPLLEELPRVIRAFYGADSKTSPDYGRLVNERHFRRVLAYLNDGTIVHGGHSDADALWIEPTLLADIPPGSAVAREEIFGPVLPVLPYDDLDAVLEELKTRPVPLALYLHTRQRAVEEKILAGTRSGGVCVNDHLMQAGVHELPFGGLGASGRGRYHGRHGFETFSHQRAVLRQPACWDNPLRYPPGESKLPWIRRLMK